MSAFLLDRQKLPQLKDKVVVLTDFPTNIPTGGANGIGAETVRLLSSHGAKVVFGDVDTEQGMVLANSLSPNVCFVQTDVTSYSSVLQLFKKAFELYQRVDIAVSNAGLGERPEWFEPSMNLVSVQKEPNTITLDVNLRGSLFVARVASVYLRQNAKREDNKSLILLSSVAGFEESPGIFVYQAAKHGIIGLMRSLRKYSSTAYDEANIRVNCVCPWATKTAMIQEFEDAWEKEGLPINTCLDVAEVVAAIALEGNLNGESVYVEGGNSWLFEENLRRLQPQWLGESAFQNLIKGQTYLATGLKWNISKEL
ncbi:Short-chain dehydrogenase reductase 3a [Trichoderma lentiforme]|uniref:Short-chain dehydrogenase reductase 3a n=1 Tax=Trichoderma lentiforme TaxID=1567552 RepID=A0A9P5C7X2_9HYPO|nr:Short-chain dehydrogenase reductase 3a [Trichoderma lentiforme]